MPYVDDWAVLNFLLRDHSPHVHWDALPDSRSGNSNRLKLKMTVRDGADTSTNSSIILTRTFRLHINPLSKSRLLSTKLTIYVSRHAAKLVNKADPGIRRLARPLSVEASFHWTGPVPEQNHRVDRRLSSKIATIAKRRSASTTTEDEGGLPSDEVVAAQNALTAHPWLSPAPLGEVTVELKALAHLGDKAEYFVIVSHAGINHHTEVSSPVTTSDDPLA